MLPLYAINDVSMLRSRERARCIEQIAFDFKKPPPVIEVLECEKLLECTSSKPFELPSKVLTYGNCNHLLDVHVGSEVYNTSASQLLAAEGALKVVFNEALTVSAPDLLIPALICVEIDMQTEVDTLGKDGLLGFMEESVAQNRLLNAGVASDPVSTERIDAFLLEDSKPSKFSANFTKDVLQQLAVRAEIVAQQRVLLETIPFDCPPDLFTDPQSWNLISIVESLLQHKELPKPKSVYIYGCGKEDFTERLLQQAEKRALFVVPQAQNAAPLSHQSSSLLAHFHDVLPEPSEMPTATFHGDVGLILPNLATERGTVSSRVSACKPGAAWEVLREAKHLRTTTLLTACPRAFLYDTRNQPYFSGVMERLIDLQSPHELMPIRHRMVVTEDPLVKLITETLEELDLHTRPLSPKALPCSASPLHSSVLNSLPLHDEELLESHALRVKRRKTAVDDPSGREGGLGSRAREFVQTAALGAVLDEVEEDQKHELACGEHTEMLEVPQKRKVVESEEQPEPATKQAKFAEDPPHEPPAAGAVDAYASAGCAPSQPLLQSVSHGRVVSCAPPELPESPTARAPARPTFQFNMSLGQEDLVEQYLRLQRGEGPRTERNAPMVRGGPSSASYVTPPCATAKTPTAVVAPTAAPGALGVVQVTPARISETEAVRLRMQQLFAHNTLTFHAAEQPLTVLISESFLTKHYPSVVGSVSAMGVVMVDCPLQEPVSIVLDHFTAVCVVSATEIQDKSELKGLVKKLSEITFKFSKIVVLIILDFEPSEGLKVHTALNQALLTLTQAVSRFPAAVTVRQCSSSPADLAAVLGQLCTQSMREAVSVLPAGASARHFHRPFLDHLQHCDAKYLAHCEFLQLFPTLNFFTAAALLHHHSVRELVGQRVGALCELFSRQYVCSEELRDQLKSFVALLEAHAGLELHTE